ncbi:MAG TPA: dienelactone hydrolase family protein [Gaiellaceae bacterium]
MTRSLFWCSAVLLLAACGSARATHDPFAYAPRPLAVHDDGVVMSSRAVAVHTLSFAGANGTRVNAFLIVPRTAGRHAAVLFLHGSGGTREDLLVPAAELATRGAVTMTISQPNDAATFRPLVVNARRALDLLAARADVDRKRLGLVGYSLGAQTAAILAGDESRLHAVGIVAGRGSQTPRYWIARAHAHLYFQAGTRDERVPHAQILALIGAAPGHPRVSWYDTGHGMSLKSFDDQVAWQVHELGLR